MKFNGLVFLAAAAAFNVATTANAQVQTPLEIQEGISIKTANLKAAFNAGRTPARQLILSTAGINISMFPGPGNLAMYSVGEIVGRQNGNWILTEANHNLPPVPVQIALQDADANSNSQSVQSDSGADVPGVKVDDVSRIPYSYVRIHGRIYLKRSVAQSGWRAVDPGILAAEAPEVPKGSVPPPAPAPEPAD